MRKPLMMLLTTSLFLAGCGGWSNSRVNPGNWFGKSRSSAVETVVDPASVNPLIPTKSSIIAKPEPVDYSVPITNITELRVEKNSTGATIFATGVAGRQGAYAARLVLDPVGEDSPTDTLSYTFRVTYPDNATPAGPERTRTIIGAKSLTNQELRGIRLIRVKGGQNIRETRRRQ
ncbi:MAG: hypothetical protein COC12_06055 [Rhodobacteraceae bacterium]|nr:MAG: hypothetical protein COC12_06055 [Paracoccaceae bacterium]